MSNYFDEKITLIRNKYEIVDYLEEVRCDELLNVDVIDISGAVIASDSWLEFINNRISDLATWRILLLKPGSYGARIRAHESTTWKGDQGLLEKTILERSRKISEVASRHHIQCEIRWYSSVPISRYMKVGENIFQSYYPSDSTGSYTPIVLLNPDSILGRRAEKEFNVMWENAKIFAN